eukprot:EG_transcript_20444
MSTHASSALARILLVEDNVVCQKMMNRMVTKLGYECVVIDNGLGAVEAVPQCHPMVVLMDLGLPILSGQDATREIRRWEESHRSPHVPIVALTSNEAEGTEAACLAEGFDGFLSKPCHPSTLQALLDKLGAPPSA